MAKRWPVVQLGDVAQLNVRGVAPDPSQSYRLVGVKWWGQGVYHYDTVDGTETCATTLHQMRRDDVVINKIWARNGSVGVVPDALDGAFGSTEFPTYEVDRERLEPRWIHWLSRSPILWAQCNKVSRGTSGKNRMKPHEFLRVALPLPPLDEQRRILARLDGVERLEQARHAAIDAMDAEAEAMLRSAFASLIDGAPLRPMAEVAPLVRRQVEIDPDQVYTEIGVKSFYKGIFHRRSVPGAEFSWQKLFWIEKGDIVFSNLMAWEQAIAEAFERDHGCVGNHRMLTCQSLSGLMVPGFLSYFFRTPSGFAEIVKASPGTAARNKTLSPTLLAYIQVPTPSFDKQLWFDRLQAKVREMRAIRELAARDAGALLPAMLHEIFGDGEA